MANQNQSLFYLCKDACLGFGVRGLMFGSQLQLTELDIKYSKVIIGS
jgi:hypothetical protein